MGAKEEGERTMGTVGEERERYICFKAGQKERKRKGRVIKRRGEKKGRGEREKQRE